MKSILYTLEEKCIGCNKCIYNCPVIDANVSFIPEEGNNKIRVNDEKCIMCGRCLDVCDHQARDYYDDTRRLFEGLAAGREISLVAAPAVKTNFPHYKKLFAFFKSRGIKKIYDVSYGADITTWAYLKVIQEKQLKSVIAQPCPSIVNYIQKYRHDLLEALVPVQSPILCTAIYLKKYLQEGGEIAFLSPCIGKIWEINEPQTYGSINYNVTFRKLAAYLEEGGVDLESYPEEDYDLVSLGLGDIYSFPGGLKENVYYYFKDAWVKQVEGTDLAYGYLGEYSRRKRDRQSLPLLVDILSCQHGCNIGSGTCKDRDVTDIEETTNRLRASKGDCPPEERARVLEFFQGQLKLEDFLRGYPPEEVTPFREPSGAELDEIYGGMGKDTQESRDINCNACGYVSCLQMARAIFNRCNHKENCLDYNIKQSVEKNVLEVKNKEIMEILRELEAKTGELTEANEKLTELDRLKTDFLSTVSHELRTPLTSVLGFAKIIQKKTEGVLFPLVPQEDKKVQRTLRQVKDNLGIIIAEGERLTSLINDVLDIAKMEAGKVEWKMERASLEEIIRQGIGSVSSLFTQKGLRLACEIDEGLPGVICDRDRVIQVIINLLSNALKFTEKGKVVCRARQDDGGVTVSISDQGVGISREDQEKVFDKFLQIGDTLTDKPVGTGLGLPICKEIIEHHGGMIWVESEPGRGSIFSFTLPVQEGGAPVGRVREMGLEKLMKDLQDHALGQEISPGKDKAILVVDDEANIRQYLKQELEGLGYRVSEARDGLEAIHEAKESRPDLIILDVMMPRMSGFDAAAVLKNDPATMDIPIVILSIVEDRARGYRVGVDRYFTKPINMDELQAEVEKLVSLGSSRRKVMVIDEDQGVLQTLSQVLQARGYQVIKVSNGQDSIRAALEEKPEMIIIDGTLSTRDGVMESLRGQKGMDNVLFVILGKRED